LATSSPQLGENPGDPERVENEVLAAATLLPFVALGRKDERALEQLAIDVRVVFGHLSQELFEEVVVPLGGWSQDLVRHKLILARGSFGTPGRGD
jgi:hypothetical protein